MTAALPHREDTVSAPSEPKYTTHKVMSSAVSSASGMGAFHATSSDARPYSAKCPVTGRKAGMMYTMAKMSSCSRHRKNTCTGGDMGG
jgi:hypothetical protein